MRDTVRKVNITRCAYYTDIEVYRGVFANVREILKLNCHSTACIRGCSQVVAIVAVIAHHRAAADIGRIIRYVRRNNVYSFYRLSKYRFVALNRVYQSGQLRTVAYPCLHRAR